MCRHLCTCTSIYWQAIEGAFFKRAICVIWRVCVRAQAYVCMSVGVCVLPLESKRLVRLPVPVSVRMYSLCIIWEYVYGNIFNQCDCCHYLCVFSSSCVHAFQYTWLLRCFCASIREHDIIVWLLEFLARRYTILFCYVRLRFALLQSTQLQILLFHSIIISLHPIQKKQRHFFPFCVIIV